MRTSPDAEANGRETKLHQALSSSAGHFAAQCLRVSSVTNEHTLLQTPGSAGITGLVVSWMSSPGDPDTCDRYRTRCPPGLPSLRRVCTIAVTRGCAWGLWSG